MGTPGPSIWYRHDVKGLVVETPFLMCESGGEDGAWRGNEGDECWFRFVDEMGCGMKNSIEREREDVMITLRISP